MVKVLVYIQVPFIEENYEVFLPINKSIKNVIDLLIEAISDLVDEDVIGDYQRILYNAETGRPYSLNETIHSSDIGNGTVLILC